MPVFTANVPGPLKIGDRIEIWGKIKDNARKMSVNLCAQEGEEPRDVVLHFDVRFHRDNIISLSRKNGVWIGSGNYDTNYNMFVPGTIFRIIFEIKDTDVITIYCQGKFHSNFLPKIPLSMAKYLVAWADIDRITHCYFHLANLKSAAGDEASPQQGLYPPASPRPTGVPGDMKQCHRIRTKTSPHGHTSESSEDDDNMKLRPKTEGRADRYFYDTLMCKPPDYKFTGSPDSSKFRQRPEYSRKHPIRSPTLTDTEKNDSEDYSEEIASQNMDSSSVVDSEDILPEVKKHGKRSKFPFSQVVNFMGKSNRKS